VDTMQTPQSLSSGKPIPITSSPHETEGFKRWNQTTSNLLTLVELLNLTFEQERDARCTQMSNSFH
jgi:hypothetical protein